MTDHPPGPNSEHAAIGPPPPRWTDLLGRAAVARPKSILGVAVALAILGGVLGWLRLPLDANTDSLIARDRPWMRDYLAFLEEFGDLEYLYAVVDTKGDRARGEAAVDDLVTRLRAIPELPEVHGRIEPHEQLRLTTRAAPTEDLRGLADAAAALPLLAQRGDWLAQGEANLARLLSPEGLALPPLEQRELAAGGLLLLDAVASVGEAARGEPPQLALAAPLGPRYLESSTGRMLFIAMQPRKDFGTLTAIEGPLKAIRRAIAETRVSFPEVDIGLTGKPVLQADELATSVGDISVAFAFGLTFVALLCVVVYRDWRRPLLAIVAFALAVGWTHGAAAIVVGRLTLLSMVFMLVLIGAGLDYAVHVLNRYAEYRQRLGIPESVRRTLHMVAPGTLTGAVTSAAVFLLALLSDFGGLRELGIIAAFGLAFCAIAMLTVLPALLVLFDDPCRPKPARLFWIPGDVLATSAPAAVGALVVFALVIAGAGIAIFFSLRFESNLLKLQSPALESVVWEHRILADSRSASWFGAVPCPDEDALARVIERAKAEPEIGEVRSLYDLVAPTTPERTALRERIASESIERGGTPEVAWSAAALGEAAKRVRGLASLASMRAGSAEVEGLRRLADRLDAAAAQPPDLGSPGASVRDRVADAAAAIVDGARLPLRDALPAAVRDRIVSPGGVYLAQLVPSGDTWEFGPLASFVEAMRRVDPGATGVPVTQSESIRDMYRAFLVISLWSVVAVSFLVYLDFRSISAVLLCTGVLLVGIVLTLGTLAVLGLPLSLANFFGVPILIGLGIDNNIHLLHRVREGGRAAIDGIAFGTTRSAVILTAIITAIGFGGQVFANHRGMQGLGWIIVIGSFACLAASVWLLPALLRLFADGRPRDIAAGQADSSTESSHASSSTPSGSASRNARP